VSLVAILDADKEGYLRSSTSLIQTSGRAARNVNGEVIMYADKVTDSMAEALRETERRREIQGRYNTEHGITPESIKSNIHELLQTVYERDYYTVEVEAPTPETFASPAELAKRIAEMEAAMRDAARRLDFEHAAELRDRVRALKRQQVK
jgi:excinuclease ABC subunit B